MFCNKCGNQVPDNSAFCPVCGNNLAANSYGRQQNQQMYGQGAPGQQYQQGYGQGAPGQQYQQGYGQGAPGQQYQQGYGQGAPGQQYQQEYGQGAPGQFAGQQYQQNPYGNMQRNNQGMPNGQFGQPAGKAPAAQNKNKMILLISIIAGVILIGGCITWILVSKHNKDKKESEEIQVQAAEYLEKSAKADDVTCAGTVQTAMQTGLADEDCYEEVSNASRNSGGEVTILSIEAAPHGEFTADNVSAVGPNVKAEVYSSLAGGVPIKYTKKGAKYYVVTIEGEMLKTYISTTPGGRDWQIFPSTDPEYQ